MATWSDEFSSGWASLILEVTESGTSAETNKGKISWKLKIKKLKSCTSHNNGGATVRVTIGGTRRYDGDSFDIQSLSVGSTKTLASGSFTVTHASDGTLSLSCSASLTSGVSLGNASISSKTFTGITIPRASSISSITSTVEANGTNAVKISISRHSSSFTHTVAIKFGNQTKSLTGVGTSTSYVIPTEWLSEIPAALSSKATVTVTTYSGSTKIGSAVSGTFTIKVPDDAAPSITSVALSEAVEKVTEAFGEMYVQNLSQINVDISAEGIYGSEIKEYSTSLDGISYKGQAFMSQILKSAGDLTVNVTVTDTRGRTNSESITISVESYNKPYVEIEFVRRNPDGTKNSKGTRIDVVIKGSVYPVGEQNSKALKLLYKAMTDEQYTERAVDVSLLDWNFETDPIIINNTDPSITYEFVAELSDKITAEDPITAVTSTGVICFSRLAGGRGVRFFSEAEEEGFWIDELNYIANPQEVEALQGLPGGLPHRRFIDWIYPVGSVMMLDNPDIDPNMLFSNQVWELVGKGLKRSYYTYANNPEIVKSIGSTTSDDLVIQVVVDGNSLYVQVSSAFTVANAETNRVVCTLDYASLGFARIPLTARSAGGGDEAEAAVLGSLAYDTGAITLYDAIPKVDGNTIPADKKTQIAFASNIDWNAMDDAFCDKFYWRRVGSTTDAL